MHSIIKRSDSNRVLIIGNGFDLDLGWNTRFCDFMKSTYWPKNEHSGSLLHHLERCRNLTDWFDLEYQIGVYASGGVTRGDSKGTQKINREYYEKMVDGFKMYLKEATMAPINSNCVAAIVLKAIQENSNFSAIYTFNYTPLGNIGQSLGLKSRIIYEHVHGSLQDDSIIIGAPEDVDVNVGYEFLYKTFNEHYSSNALIHDLGDAKEVVFFGHSLGPTDYHYFQEFFKAQCVDGLPRKDAKKITIFTYDDASRIAILTQLRKMNEKKTNLLYNQNDFKIIMTSRGESPELKTFLKHLRQTTKQRSSIYSAL